MADNHSRRGAADVGTLLMLASFLVIGGFMFWLSQQAANERAMSIVEDTADVDDVRGGPMAGATAVTAADIMTDATPYEGQVVAVEASNVQSMFGQQGFWLEFPAGPFLVSVSDSLRAANPPDVRQGSAVRVTGTVTPMNDSIAASWFEAGRISEGEQLTAAFAVHFLNAIRVEVSAGGPSGGA